MSPAAASLPRERSQSFGAKRPFPCGLTWATVSPRWWVNVHAANFRTRVSSDHLWRLSKGAQEGAAHAVATRMAALLIVCGWRLRTSVGRQLRKTPANPPDPNREASKISRKSNVGDLSRSKALQKRYGSRWSLLRQSMWSLTSQRIFSHQPKETFSTVSARNGHSALDSLSGGRITCRDLKRGYDLGRAVPETV